jgi:hypothetical protein
MAKRHDSRGLAEAVRSTRLLASAILAMLIVGCGGGSGGPDNPMTSPPTDTALTEPIGSAVVLASGLKGEQLVGQSHSGRVVIVPTDSRNRITGLQIANPSAGGATPTIDAQGVVTWVPNEVDFQGTRILLVTVQLATGNPQQVQLNTAVRKERLVLETAVRLPPVPSLTRLVAT